MCALVLSLGSCQKDYSEDIDQLKADVAANKLAISALQTAINAGKLVTNVTANTAGYLITFSDNTTIQVNHGAAGATGATGAPGATGTPGATGATGFTPIIGVDAQGYWTVVTSQGGTPVRITNPAGDPIKADSELTVVDGVLYAGGVATEVEIPEIVYNSTTNQIYVTVEGVTYKLPLSEDVVFGTDILSLTSPIGTTTAIVSYGQVPTAANKTQVNPVAATADAAVAWAGLSYGQLIRSAGKVPVIINPAAASIAGYTFEIIKQDGSLYRIQPSSVSAGYTGDFAQFLTASTTNGLYTLNLTPALADAIAAVGTTTQLAIRAGKNGREIVSGYQYSVRVQADVETTFGMKAAYAGTYPPVYIKIGTQKDLLSFFDRTDLTPNRTLIPTDFYKSAAVIDPIPGNSDVEDLISTTAYSTTVSTATTTATVSNLNDKAVNFKIRTFDWIAKYKETALQTVFYSALDNAISAIPVGTFTLTASTTLGADTKTIMLTSMFTELDAVGKTELWRNQATNVKIVNVPAGVSYQFLDAANNAVGAVNATLTAVADVQAIRKVAFIFDETVAVPNTYSTMKLTFADRRAYSTDVFSVSMPVTIVNPTVDLSAAAAHKANMFNGQVLTVYGTHPTNPVAQSAYPTYYDLYKAYVNLTANATETLPAIGYNNYRFVSTDAVTAQHPNPLSGVLSVNSNERFAVTNLTIYDNYTVDLYYYYFGNTDNKVKLETITVTSKSEVKEGNMVALTPASPALPILQVTNGDLATVKHFAPYYRINDYLGNNLGVFATRDVRVAAVTATPQADLAHLVSLTPNGTDWDIKATNAVAELPTTYVDVPVVVEITDLYSVKKSYTLNIRVVKP